MAINSTQITLLKNLYNKYFLAEEIKIGQPINFIPKTIRDLEQKDQESIKNIFSMLESSDYDNPDITEELNDFKKLLDD